jgi:hypothetical protein
MITSPELLVVDPLLGVVPSLHDGVMIILLWTGSAPRTGDPTQDPQSLEPEWLLPRWQLCTRSRVSISRSLGSESELHLEMDLPRLRLLRGFIHD